MADAQVFIDEVAFGPGAWDLLAPEDRARLASNAGTFLEEMQDSRMSTLDLAALAACPTPMMVTIGDRSPPYFEKVVDVLRSCASRRSPAPAICRT